MISKQNIVFHSLKIVNVLANSADADEMPHLRHFICVFTACRKPHLAVSNPQRVQGVIYSSASSTLSQVQIHINPLMDYQKHTMYYYNK